MDSTYQKNLTLFKRSRSRVIKLSLIPSYLIWPHHIMHTYQPYKTVQTGSPCLLFNLIMTTYGGPTATLTYKLYCANLSIVFWANNHAKIRIEANYQKFQTLIDLFSLVLCLSVFARTTLTKTISCYHPLSQSLTKQFKSMVPNCPGQKRLKLI